MVVPLLLTLDAFSAAIFSALLLNLAGFFQLGKIFITWHWAKMGKIFITWQCSLGFLW